jgi:ABC-type dipeptide/oligopeptide/nickel transport system permease component
MARRMTLFIGRRFLFLIPQLIGISLVSFFLVRLMPGNPAYAIAGQLATEEQIAAIEQRMQLDKPIPVQYVAYLSNVLQGDFGISWRTSNPVLVDIKQRLPATIQLITIALLVIAILGVVFGVLIATNPRGIASRIMFVYGLLAGAMPDFWLGLLLIFFFYFKLQWAPPPVGQYGLEVFPPPPVTGMSLIDSTLARDPDALRSAAAHLVLPELTLILIYIGGVVRMTSTTMSDVLDSGFIHYGKANGLPNRTITRYALRNSLPPVVTVLGIIYGFLLGGAVLVETVFAWGGIGQYAVQSIVNSDYLAIQGFVLIAAVFTLAVYLIIDIIYFFLDPRAGLD